MQSNFIVDFALLGPYLCKNNRVAIFGPLDPLFPGVETVKNANLFISGPMSTYDTSFFSAQLEEQLQTIFYIANIYPPGGGYYPKTGT